MFALQTSPAARSAEVHPGEAGSLRPGIRYSAAAFLTCLTCLICLSGTAYAADGGNAGSGTPKTETAGAPPQKTSSEGETQKTEVVYEKKTVLDFSDVTLEGELTRPEGSYVLNRRKARFDSLVETRKDFVPELDRTTDEF